MIRKHSFAMLALAALLLAGCGGGEGEDGVNRWVAPDLADTDCDWLGTGTPAPVAGIAARAEASGETVLPHQTLLPSFSSCKCFFQPAPVLSRSKSSSSDCTALRNKARCW